MADTEIAEKRETVVRCYKCGLYRSVYKSKGGGCFTIEYGDESNSASPSGAYPVPSGPHIWAIDTGTSVKLLHRDINARTWNCDTCQRRLYDCECPTLECRLCCLDPIDAAEIGTTCEHAPDGEHDWQERGE